VRPGGPKRRFLRLLDRTLNRVTIRLARAGRGPFSAVRHVGRRSGRTYETPLILAPVTGGFVAELTYGPDVDWYRNVVAAGGGTVLHRGAEYAVDGVSPVAAADGLRAFGGPAAVVLRVLRRHEFRLLHVAGPAGTP
jgi:deazaflavin-dependent oxidoreductase (nitroreductase family)